MIIVLDSSPFINGEATIVDFTGGQAIYSVEQGQITTPGHFPCEVEISIAGSVVSTIADELVVTESA